jgi:hypothetical protein
VPELPVAPLLEDGHLILEPLRVAHAGVMVRALSEPGLYKYTGASPPTEEELRYRYGRQVRGPSPKGGHLEQRQERWFNWVVREHPTVWVTNTVAERPVLCPCRSLSAPTACQR